MLRNKGLYVASAVVVAALGFAFISQVFAQESRPARGGRGGTFDPAQFQAQMDKAMQDRLGVTEDEWKVLQPKIEKVRTAQRDARGGGMFGMGGPGMGGRGGRGGRGGNNPPADQPAQPDNAPAQSEVQKASTALGKVLENKEAKPEDIKAALTTLRDAKVKAKTELEKAQKDLKEVLTLKQEAQFVMMGMLE